MSDKSATKDTPKGESWRFQLSWKLGQHMLNVRADSIEEFRQSLKDLMDAPEMIVSALTSFEFEQPAPVPQAITAPAVAPRPQNGGTEIGPIKLTGYADKPGVSGPESKTPGKPYVRHAVTFENGVEASTFDGLVASVAQTLLGKMCFARLEQRGKYYNLSNIRPAA